MFGLKSRKSIVLLKKKDSNGCCGCYCYCYVVGFGEDCCCGLGINEGFGEVGGMRGWRWVGQR